MNRARIIHIAQQQDDRTVKWDRVSYDNVYAKHNAHSIEHRVYVGVWNHWEMDRAIADAVKMIDASN